MAQWLSICLPPMWPRIDSQTRRHMWVEFVLLKKQSFQIPNRSGIRGPSLEDYMYLFFIYTICSTGHLHANKIRLQTDETYKNARNSSTIHSSRMHSIECLFFV